MRKYIRLFEEYREVNESWVEARRELMVRVVMSRKKCVKYMIGRSLKTPFFFCWIHFHFKSSFRCVGSQPAPQAEYRDEYVKNPRVLCNRKGFINREASPCIASTSLSDIQKLQFGYNYVPATLHPYACHGCRLQRRRSALWPNS